MFPTNNYWHGSLIVVDPIFKALACPQKCGSLQTSWSKVVEGLVLGCIYQNLIPPITVYF